MIRYTDSLTNISEDMLGGFFDGWPNPLSPSTHLRILQNSAHVILAIDDAADKVVGFINALSDGVLFAYIPLLEVLPSYQGRDIGKQLVVRMLAMLQDLYAIDLLCDQQMQAFYNACGMSPASGMMVRNYASQSGRSP